MISKIEGEYLNFIQEVADAKLEKFSYQGYADAGRNGPYGNSDTPARNTAHWLNIYGFLWQKNQKKVYLDMVRLFADYLVRADLRGISGAIIAFKKKKKFDNINGLIGQAWVIEALARAAILLKNEKYYYSALQIFKVQKFSEMYGLWERVDANGQCLGFDYVYNHQLWFAAAGSLLLSYRYHPQVEACVRAFLTRSVETFSVYQSGLIRHWVNNIPLSNYIKIKRIIKEILRVFLAPLNIFHIFFHRRYLEEGYHWFNLLGFGLLYKRYRNMSFFSSQAFRKALKYGLSFSILSQVSQLQHLQQSSSKILTTKLSKYLFCYNSPAFEYPAVCALFEHPCSEEQATTLWDIQNSFFYDKSGKMYVNNNPDPETLTARLYELTYALDNNLT
jgi:hypothetical protein